MLRRHNKRTSRGRTRRFCLAVFCDFFFQPHLGNHLSKAFACNAELRKSQCLWFNKAFSDHICSPRSKTLGKLSSKHKISVRNWWDLSVKLPKPAAHSTYTRTLMVKIINHYFTSTMMSWIFHRYEILLQAAEGRLHNRLLIWVFISSISPRIRSMGSSIYHQKVKYTI